MKDLSIAFYICVASLVLIGVVLAVAVLATIFGH